MATKSLKAQQSELSNTQRQLEILSNGIFKNGQLPTFKQKLKRARPTPNTTEKAIHSSNQYWLYVQPSLCTLSC